MRGEKLHKKEEKLIEFIRELRFGEVTIKVQDGLPVMVERAKEKGEVMTDCKYRNGEQCQKVIDYNERFKAEFCDHCCDGCKHAIEMTCSIVCAYVANKYCKEE